MIGDLDDTLKQLLTQKVPLDPAQVDITFDMPDREWSGGLTKPTVNLYLYDIRENRELRATDWATRQLPGGTIERRLVPRRIALSYLITVWTRQVEDEHRLLWSVLSVLMRHPELQEDLIQGDLKSQGHPVRLVAAQGDGVLSNPGDFWAALDNQLKPSVSLTATVELDLEIAALAPPVAEVKVGTRNLLEEPDGETKAAESADAGAKSVSAANTRGKRK